MGVGNVGPVVRITIFGFSIILYFNFYFNFCLNCFVFLVAGRGLPVAGSFLPQKILKTLLSVLLNHLHFYLHFFKPSTFNPQLYSFCLIPIRTLIVFLFIFLSFETLKSLSILPNFV